MLKYKLIIDRGDKTSDTAVILVSSPLRIGDTVGVELRGGFKYRVTKITEAEGKTPIARVK